MVNCTKCGAEVDHPLKTWKIKQTPVALYECPSCKTKWRTKFIEESIAPYLMLSKTAKEVESPVTTEANKEGPVIEAISTMVENHVAEPSKPTGVFSGLRTFLSSLFS